MANGGRTEIKSACGYRRTVSNFNGRIRGNTAVDKTKASKIIVASSVILRSIANVKTKDTTAPQGDNPRLICRMNSYISVPA